MPSWPAKDPDAVYNYRYLAPLDDGDSLMSGTVSVLAGTVSIVSQTLFATGIDVLLAGGAQGETAVFLASWTTERGNADDDVITMAVESNEAAALVLHGYAKPLPAHLVARYPAFANVPVLTLRQWLADAEAQVDTSWSEGDYAFALMALAAHNMVRQGIGASGMDAIPAGVTSFRSAGFSATIVDSAAKASASGVYGATIYGQDFERLLRRNKAGPRLIGHISC